MLLEKARNFIKGGSPEIDFGKLGPVGFNKKSGNEKTLVSFGSKGGETEFSKKMTVVFSNNSQTSSKHPLGGKLKL